MPVPVTITLNSIVGSPGPFDLYSCTGSTCSGTPFITGVTLSSLSSGTLAPDGTTHIKIKSTGAGCDYETTPILITNIPTPSPTPTVTPTATPTVTPTVTPTPTNTPNVTIDPNLFYYAMGDCSDMRYVYTSYTATGFSPLIVVPGCDTLSQIGQMAMANAAHTSYVLAEPLDPCGFGSGYTGSFIARSSVEIPEGSVYTVGSQCLSVISVSSQYVTGTTINLDEETYVGIGDAACGSCSPPFTGYTITGYSGVTCDTGDTIIAYSALGGFTIGNVYGIQLFSGGTAQGDARCMTINANIGPQFTLTDPINDPLVGYQITDTGPIQIPVTFSGYSNCDACEGIVVDGGKYQIDAERCDNPSFSVTLWSDTAPTVVSGNTIQISGPLSEYCWRVTLANQFKSSVGIDLGDTIIDTGCDCNGDNGGGNVNVDNVVFAPSAATNTGGECQSPMGQYYTETTSTEMELTFRDSSNNPVTPNGAVQYRVSGGNWQSLSVTGSTVTFSVTLINGDNSNCIGGTGVYADTLDIKVGTITVDTYTAGGTQPQ